MLQLSFVIPVYNLEKYIPSTLNSLFDQTEKQFEIIVVDDGSTDKSAEVATNLLKQTTIKSKIIRKENGGVSSARNRGLEEASGKYVIFLDGDDTVAPQLVQTIYETIEIDDFDIICWGFNKVDQNNVHVIDFISTHKPLVGGFTGIEVLHSWIINKTFWICTGSAAYNRAFLIEEKLGYTEGCSAGEDLEFTIKALSKTNSVFIVNSVLTYYVLRQGSATNIGRVKAMDFVNALKRATQFISESRDVRVNKIIDQILRITTVEYYFITLCQCVLSFNKRLIDILRDIDYSYPGLNNEMSSLMKKYKGTDVKWRVKFKLFLVSPEVCFYFLKLLNRVKG